MAYLDDSLIYSRTEKEHLEMLDKAFKHLLKAGLKIRLSKCLFFKEQIHYLGHLASETSILWLAHKIEALMKFKPPTNVKEVKHFLGLTGYYHKFICNYADVAYPLNCLTHKVQLLIWTLEGQVSFDMLHLKFANTPIVQSPDQNKPYLLFTDAWHFLIQVCSPKHPLLTPMKTLRRYSLVRLPSQVLSHKHRTFNFH